MGAGTPRPTSECHGTRLIPSRFRSVVRLVWRIFLTPALQPEDPCGPAARCCGLGIRSAQALPVHIDTWNIFHETSILEHPTPDIFNPPNLRLKILQNFQSFFQSFHCDAIVMLQVPTSTVFALEYSVQGNPAAINLKYRGGYVL